VILLERDDDVLVLVNVDHIVAVTDEGDGWCRVADSLGNSATFKGPMTTIHTLIRIARRERRRLRF
jgi:hypothetical protein